LKAFFRKIPTNLPEKFAGKELDFDFRKSLAPDYNSFALWFDLEVENAVGSER
jgi:hypothetical protein